MRNLYVRSGQALIEALWAIVLVALVSLVMIGVMSSSAKVTMRGAASNVQQANVSETQGFLLRRISEAKNVLSSATRYDLRLQQSNGDCYRFVYIAPGSSFPLTPALPNGPTYTSNSMWYQYLPASELATNVSCNDAAGLNQLTAKTPKILYSNITNDLSANQWPFQYFVDPGGSDVNSSPQTTQIVQVDLFVGTTSKFIKSKELKFNAPLRTSFGGCTTPSCVGNPQGGGGTPPVGSVVAWYKPSATANPNTLGPGWFIADGSATGAFPNPNLSVGSGPQNPFCDAASATCNPTTPNLINRFVLGANPSSVSTGGVPASNGAAPVTSTTTASGNTATNAAGNTEVAGPNQYSPTSSGATDLSTPSNGAKSLNGSSATVSTAEISSKLSSPAGAAFAGTATDPGVSGTFGGGGLTAGTGEVKSPRLSQFDNQNVLTCNNYGSGETIGNLAHNAMPVLADAPGSTMAISVSSTTHNGTLNYSTVAGGMHVNGWANGFYSTSCGGSGESLGATAWQYNRSVVTDISDQLGVLVNTDVSFPSRSLAVSTPDRSRSIQGSSALNVSGPGSWSTVDMRPQYVGLIYIIRVY